MRHLKSCLQCCCPQQEDTQPLQTAALQQQVQRDLAGGCRCFCRATGQQHPLGKAGRRLRCCRPSSKAFTPAPLPQLLPKVAVPSLRTSPGRMPLGEPSRGLPAGDPPGQTGPRTALTSAPQLSAHLRSPALPAAPRLNTHRPLRSAPRPAGAAPARSAPLPQPPGRGWRRDPGWLSPGGGCRCGLAVTCQSLAPSELSAASPRCCGRGSIRAMLLRNALGRLRDAGTPSAESCP